MLNKKELNNLLGVLFLIIIIGVIVITLMNRNSYEKEIYNFPGVTKGVIISHEWGRKSTQIKYRYRVNKRIYNVEASFSRLSEEYLKKVLLRKKYVIIYSTKDPEKSILFLDERLRNNARHFDFINLYHNLPYLK